MRVVFAGTPEFAATALQALLDAGFDVPLVLTQPDRPAGRGMKLHASPVKQLAQAHKIALSQPRSLRLDGKYPDDAAAARGALDAAHAQVLVVAAYGLILPQWVLDAVPCLNIHASLLPRWRGAAPIQRAIEAGDTHSGVTIMQMDAGLDTGPMLLKQAIELKQGETAASLHDRLASLGGSLIRQALVDFECGRLVAQPQPADGITYARKIEKSEGLIDWRQTAEQIERRVRAFDPFPGASTTLPAPASDGLLKIWRCEIDSKEVPIDDRCGQIIRLNADECVVATAKGAVRLLQVQRPGGKRMGVRDFLRAGTLALGQVLGS